MMGQEVEMKVKYSDYKKTDYGYVLPYTFVMSFGDQFSLTVRVKKVDFNKPVDVSIFDMGK